MDSEVVERLNILNSSGQINNMELEKTFEAIKYVEEKYKIKVEKEVGGMFAVHFAKALNRILSGDGIETTPKEVLDSIGDSQHIIEDVKELLSNIADISKVPIGEINFITMYIDLLLKKNNQTEGR